MKTRFAESGTHQKQRSIGSIDPCFCSHPGSRTILFISDDRQMHENLRSLANTMGQVVVRTEGAAGAVAILLATRPVAVLLDLDLPNEAAWEIAELLLKEPSCPPVILLTGRTSQFDMRTAVRAGSLVSKRTSPSQVLEIIDEALQMPQVNQAERNSIQRVLIRWLRPSRWTESITPCPSSRFWGINE
jgi:DNA-binding response OmpR family regulator